MIKYLISIDKISFNINFRDTNTAEVIKKNLPLEGECNTWGKEYYFYTDLNIKIENNATNIVSKGEIAYWPGGNAIAIGFGKTPLSRNNEIRLVDKCNIWADTDFDVSILEKLDYPKKIRVYINDQY